ncbi:MAG: DNA repair protein RadC [Bacteroidales bacterium]|jgi:DNA repair protein RadC|nr:DNA repair protein RadC [Bacteroidales bacterium]
MEPYEKKSSIRFWAEDERPREKLALKGKMALSDAELLAILIGSGNKKESAVDLSKRILKSVNNNLIELSKTDIEGLLKFKGIGQAKALTIIAALELGRRRRAAEPLQKPGIRSSKDAYEIIQSLVGDSNYEQFWVLLLNRANKLIRSECISQGGIAGTVADPKRIYKLALEHNASFIILAHNHPSGNLNPSEEDIKVTRKMKQAGEALDIRVIDHIIAGENDYYSFADKGVL